MKKLLKTTLAALLVGAVTFSFTKQQTDYSLARVGKSNNRLVFFFNEPVSEYDVAFTFVNAVPNYDCISPKEVVNVSVKNANQEAGQQNKLYDAIILGTGERDMAITWKDKTKDNAIARVSRTEGKFIFIECEPIANYDVAGKYNVEGVGQQILLGTCPTHAEKINKLLSKSNKAKINYDAIMYGSSENDLAIKFK